MDDKEYLCAFIVATDTEMSAQLSFYNWEKLSLSNDADTFYETSIERNGRKYKLVLSQANEQGMVAATALSYKLIYQFSPKYLIMTGIAAGTVYENEVSGEHEYGDVIVANTVWNYAKGKFTSADKGQIKFGDIGFIPRPSLLKLDAETESYIRAAAASPQNECRVHFGPMACGFSVVANKDIVEKQVRTQVSETVALDMESYAVMYAAQNAGDRKTIPIIVKSICDFADGRKDDKYQRFAAYTSTEFANLLIQKYLPN